MATHVTDPAAPLTPSLLTRTTRRHAELAAVIERSRDLCWWSRQLRAGANPFGRAIEGGAFVDDAAAVLVMITRVSLCEPCIVHKSGIPTSGVDDALRALAATIALTVGTRPCTACLETRTTYCFSGRATDPREVTRPNGTPHAILSFLGQQPGNAFCSDGIAAKVFTPKKNIDVAMRHLEGNDMYRRYDRCSACGKSRLVGSVPSPN